MLPGAWGRRFIVKNTKPSSPVGNVAPSWWDDKTNQDRPVPEGSFYGFNPNFLRNAIRRGSERKKFHSTELVNTRPISCCS